MSCAAAKRMASQGRRIACRSGRAFARKTQPADVVALDGQGGLAYINRTWWRSGVPMDT
jgi:hypothetical protein